MFRYNCWTIILLKTFSIKKKKEILNSSRALNISRVNCHQIELKEYLHRFPVDCLRQFIIRLFAICTIHLNTRRWWVIL